MWPDNHQRSTYELWNSSPTTTSAGFPSENWPIRGKSSLSKCHRWEYSVPSPNALWDLDGYHKLIRWRLVIHGAIDGYSRLITFLKVSPNNKAETVFFGINGSSGTIWFTFKSENGHGWGKCTDCTIHDHDCTSWTWSWKGKCHHWKKHSQPKDRVTLEGFVLGMCFFFYTLFYGLEDIGLLDVNCPFDVYALHSVFVYTHHSTAFGHVLSGLGSP